MAQIRIEYIEDEHTHKWLPHKTDGAFETVMLAQSDVAWCDYHARWEKIIRDKSGVIHFACGKQCCKPALMVNERRLSSILFLIDTKKLKLDVSFRTSMPYFVKSKKLTDKKSAVSHFDLISGETKIEHTNNAEIYYSEDLELSKVPEEIQSAIQHYLSLLTKRIYGIECKNTYKLCQNGFKHFVKYPSCPPIALLPYCFRHQVKRSSLHAFEDLCAAFNVKCAKKFRKLFLDNPSVFLVNVFLSCIGFSDKNVFNRYYNNAALIRFLESYFTCDKDRCRYLFLWSDNRYMAALHLWYLNASARNNDSVCANHLIETMLNGRTDYGSFRDALLMYSTHFAELPDPLKARILREGFTVDVHDRMSEALGRNRAGRGFKAGKENVLIEYKEEELKLQGKFELLNPDESVNLSEEQKKYRYHFELPNNTNDLFLISEKMHNCVGYAYRDRVLNKDCLIMTLEDKIEHKGVACIEIIVGDSGKFTHICQALGACNERIKEQYIPVIKNWMRLHHLSTSVNDLLEERNI